jgi:restriction endonuclease S subunit
MEFVNPPETIKLSEIINKNYTFSPSKFSKLNLSKSNTSFESLSTISKISEKRENIELNKKYTYIEIGDIDVNNGDINYKEYYGFNIPAKRPLKLQQSDILISKVRTYRKGIAFVGKDKNLTCTPAFLVIQNVSSKITQEYLYAVLRSNFFVEQILALQNRGMYPRLDKNTQNEVLVPIIKDKKVVGYLTLLIESLISKEMELRAKFLEINKVLKEEIENNQNSNHILNSSTHFLDMLTNSRIDTGLYNASYRKIFHLITGYSGGYFNIPLKKIKSGSTPKERIIGKGIKRWVTPALISEMGILSEDERIICKENNIQTDCVLIVNRTSKEGIGEYVGISMFYDFNKRGIGHHNQGCYRLEEMNKEELIILCALLNSEYYRKICGNISMGSKMKEIKSKDFAQIPFPNLDKNIKKRVLSLYSDESEYNIVPNLDNFKELEKKITLESGILKLSEDINKLKRKVEETISRIVKGKEPDISFDFILN